MDSEGKTSADVREGNPPAPAKGEEPKPPVESGAKPADGDAKLSDRPDKSKKSAKEKCSSKKHSKGKSGKSKKASSPADSSSDSDSDDSGNETSSSSSSDDSQAEAARSKKKRVAKKRQELQKSTKKTRSKKQQKKAPKTCDASESDYDSDSSEADGSGSSDDEGAQLGTTDLLKQIQLLLLQQQQQQPPHHQSHQLHQQQQHQSTSSSYAYPSGLNNRVSPPIYDTGLRHNPSRARRGGARLPGRGNLDMGGADPNLIQQQKDKKKRPKASKLDYKRVDQVWDDTIHNYKLQDTAERTVDAQYDEFIFHVRRTFDWEGKYKTTIVDIKSKLLRECLQDVIGDIKGISLVDDTPKLDPNMLFL